MPPGLPRPENCVPRACLERRSAQGHLRQKENLLSELWLAFPVLLLPGSTSEKLEAPSSNLNQKGAPLLQSMEMQTPSCGRLVATLSKMLMSPANTPKRKSKKKASEKPTLRDLPLPRAASRTSCNSSPRASATQLPWQFTLAAGRLPA